MYIAKTAILIVVLLIPNTTWQDWQSSKNPALQHLLEAACIGQMMPRTAEHDTITAAAETRTLIAGARMTSSGDTSGLGYPALQTNLTDALLHYGWQVEINTPTVREPASQTIATSTKIFKMCSLDQPLNSPGAAMSIAAWTQKVQEAGLGSSMIVIASNPTQSEYVSHERLCPIAIYQPGTRPGLLKSPSTRTLGLVANTDVAPTIAHLAGIESLPGPVYGNVFTSIEADSLSSFKRLTFLEKSAREQDMEQADLPYLVIGLSIVILAPIVLTRLTNSDVKWRVLSGIAISIPLSMIFSLTIPTAICAIVVAGIAASSLSKNLNIYLLAVSWMTIILASFDVTFDHPSFVARSIMGFSYQEGARYYGLGNEAMGAMVGAMTVISAAMVSGEIKRRWIAAMLWILLGAVFALPSIGAKAGGVLVVGVALSALFVFTRRDFAKPLTPRIVMLSVAAGLIVGVLVLALAARLGGDSHLTLTYSQTQHFGVSTLMSLIIRKLAMDFKLMLHSAWMLVLISSIVMQLFTVLKQRTYPQDRAILTTWRLGVFSTLACLFLNDAGVVAAALCSLAPLAAITASRIESNTQADSIQPVLP